MMAPIKIFVLPVNNLLRPSGQAFQYPPHNRDYGVEQDFDRYLSRKSDLITDSPRNADWHYLPVYWTRWHLNHNYAKEGREQLQELVDSSLLDDARTFTICQYDDGPMVSLGRATICLASRKGGDGVDIPLLCRPHRTGFIRPRRMYLASFMGRLSNHPLRVRMNEALENTAGIRIKDGMFSTSEYVGALRRSWIALCPRGYGGSSFRFFEAMQLGVVPLLLGDLDVRPFRRSIRWDECSFFVSDPARIVDALYQCGHTELEQMGKVAARVYRDLLAYQRWPALLIQELVALRP